MRRSLDFAQEASNRLGGFKTHVLILVLLIASAINARASDAPRAQREAAVVEARNGNAKAGLVRLQALLQQYPGDPRLLADTTIVANWAGDDALAMELYSRPETPKNDAGVAEAAARSARNLHKYDLSIELYRRAQQLEPARWQSLLGEAMALTDSEDYASANALMRPLLRNHGDEKDVMFGQAYLSSRQGDFPTAIAMYQRYLEKHPDDKQVSSDLSQWLSRVGSQTLASEVYAKSGTSAAPETERSLNQAAGGEDAGWGEVYAPTRALQRAQSETGLARLQSVIAASAPTDAAWKSAQYDRIVVLFDLQQMRNVVQAYEDLQRRGLDVPAYARRDVAGAYLALHQPERAEALYRAMLEKEPTDGTIWSGLAYAQMDRGHVYEALATIDRAYKNTSPWLRAEGLSEPKPNQMRINLESQAAEMRGGAGLLAEEQKRLQNLVDAAPGNDNVRRQLAAALLARGWPLRALEELRIADGFASNDELISLTSAEIHEAAGLRDDADAMIPALRALEFDSAAFTRFLRDEAIERGWQLDVETILGWGRGVQVGSSDQHSEAHLYSPLFNNRWRIYGHELSDSGDFVTGSTERTREGAGLHYDYNRQEGWAEFAYDEGTNRVAGIIGANLAFGDFWTLRAEADSDSFDVPVRALTGNIHGRSLDADLGWRASELRSANLGLQRVLFSDGNQRTAFSGAWNQRVWTTPRFQASVSADGWTSSNSLNENRPYFNPGSDFSLGPRASLNWLAWRRYDRSFLQQFDIYAAPYWEANYGTLAAVAVHYAQHWKLRSGLEAHCGVTWNSQPYDGARESRTALDGGITWGSR